jgi:hypothetical protein
MQAYVAHKCGGLTVKARAAKGAAISMKSSYSLLRTAASKAPSPLLNGEVMGLPQAAFVHNIFNALFGQSGEWFGKRPPGRVPIQGRYGQRALRRSERPVGTLTIESTLDAV